MTDPLSAPESSSAPKSRLGVLLRHNLLVILALSGLAVAQPLLDLFGKNPEFFVAKDAVAADVVKFGLAVTFLIPAAILAIEAVAYLVARAVGRAVHSLFVALLGAALGLTVIRQVSLDVTIVVLTIAAAIGLGLAVAERRSHGLRMGLRLLAVSPLLFLAFYLGFSSSSRLIWEDEAQVATNVEVGRDAPVVEIVFDEFPLASIMSADGTINGERFPNFARLADESSWFRNASASSWQTEHSVPSILTGEEPTADEIASSIDHPRNLFTLLGGSYEMNVDEQITDLCPSSVCEDQAAVARASTPSPSLRGSLVDAAVVYGHATLTSGLRTHLPSIGHSWGGFVQDPADQPDATPPRVDAAATSRGGNPSSADEFAYFGQWADQGVDGQSPPAQGAIIEDLIDSAATPGDGRLSFAHVVLPHYPWQMTPTGRRYASRADLPSYTERGTWPHNEFRVRQSQQQHLLQVGYSDTLIGQLIDRMQEAGTWDDALVVVVADHGVSFLPGGPQRTPTDENVDEIYRVPYFIKAPGQREGDVRDDNARLIDVLPTTVDALDLSTDWDFDGRSLFGDSHEPDEKAIPGDVGPSSIPVSTDGLYDVIDANNRRFGRDPGWRGVFAVGRLGGAVGAGVDTLATASPVDLAWSIDQEDSLAAVDLSSGFAPILVSGRLVVPPDEDLPESVLVAVNGTVAGLGGDFQESGDGYTFSALLAESTIRDGANDLQVLVPRGGAEAARYSLATHAARPEFTLAGDRLVSDDDGETPIEVTEPSEELRLEVESAFEDGQTLAIKGWSADLANSEPADAVLVFVDGDQVGMATPRQRPDLEAELGAAFAGAGFEQVVGAEQAPRDADIEVVALFGDRAVRAEVRPEL